MPIFDKRPRFPFGLKSTETERADESVPAEIYQFLRVQLAQIPTKARNPRELGIQYARGLQERLRDRFQGHVPGDYGYLRVLQNFAKEYPVRTEQNEPYEGAVLAGRAASSAAAYELEHIRTMKEEGKYSQNNIVRLNLQYAAHPNPLIAEAPLRVLDRIPVSELYEQLHKNSGKPAPDALCLIAPIAISRQPKSSFEAAAITSIRESVVRSLKMYGLESFLSRFAPKAEEVLEGVFDDCMNEEDLQEKLMEKMTSIFHHRHQYGSTSFEHDVRKLFAAVDNMPQWKPTLEQLIKRAAAAAGVSAEVARVRSGAPLQEQTRQPQKPEWKPPSGDDLQLIAEKRLSETIRYLEHVQPIPLDIETVRGYTLFQPESWTLFESKGQKKSWDTMVLSISMGHSGQDTPEERKLTALWNTKKDALLAHVQKATQEAMPTILQRLDEIPTDPAKRYVLDDFESKWNKQQRHFAYYGGDEAAVEKVLDEKKRAMKRKESKVAAHEAKLQSEEKHIQARMAELVSRYANALGMPGFDDIEMRTPREESGSFGSIQRGGGMSQGLRLDLQQTLSFSLSLLPDSDHITLELGEDDREAMIRFRRDTMAWILPHEFSHEVLNELKDSSSFEVPLQRAFEQLNTISRAERQLTDTLQHYLRESLIDGVGMQLVQRFGTPDVVGGTTEERIADMTAAVARLLRVYVNYFQARHETGNVDDSIGHERMHAVAQACDGQQINNSELRADFEAASAELETLRTKGTVLNEEQRTQLTHAFTQMQEFGRTLPLNLDV